MIRVPLQYIVDPSAVRSLISESERNLEDDEQGKTDTEAPESTRNFRLLRESWRKMRLEPFESPAGRENEPSRRSVSFPTRNRVDDSSQLFLRDICGTSRGRTMLDGD